MHSLGGSTVHKVRLALLVLGSLALTPALMPFTADDVEPGRACVPILQGWHADRPVPSDSDAKELNDVLFGALARTPSSQDMRDPKKRAAYLADEEARTSTAGYRRAESYALWVAGEGACIPEARHRLILSASALGTVAGVGLLVGWSRRRSRARPRSD